MTEPKTITFIGPMHPYRGGIAQFGESMFRGLALRGHTTHAVTFSRQYPGILFPGKTQTETKPVLNPVPALRLIDSLNPLSWFSTAKTIQGQKPHAVVFQFWLPFFGPAFGTIARRLRKDGIKVLSVVHNAIPHESRPLDRQLAGYFLSQNDGCIVLSDAVEKDLRSLGVTVPVEQIVHPVYDLFGAPKDQTQSRNQLGLPEKAKVILFFGFIRKYKGLNILLEAMQEVHQALPNLHLVVAGEFYEDEGPYRESVQTRELTDVVHFHADYIPTEDVATYFSAADVVVQPYISATQSGVAQVAFHFDKPSIVTRVGGLAEVIPHGTAGLIVPPENPQALAREIIRFYQNNLGPGLVDGVQLIKKKYSWDTVYDIVERWI